VPGTSIQVGGSDSVLAVQPDGKIVVAGAIEGPGAVSAVAGPAALAVAVTRLEPDGTVDRSFGNGGLVLHQFGKATGDGSPARSYVEAVAVQGDGKILIAGNQSDGASHELAFVARLGPDGALDTAFGAGGEVLMPARTSGLSVVDVTPPTIALTPDGKILFGGIAASADGGDFTIARLLPDGRLDRSFGPHGQVVLPGWFAGGARIIRQPNGKILVIAQNAGMALARLNLDGHPDPTFGQNGVLHRGLDDRNVNINAAALQPNGAIVLTGSLQDRAVSAADIAVLVVRLNWNGTLDHSFGSRGYVTAQPSVPDYTDIAHGGGAASVADAVALQSSGGIVIAGRAEPQQGSFGLYLTRFIGGGPPLPAISDLRLTANRFRTQGSARRSAGGTGTTFVFTTSTPSRLQITIQQITVGVLIKGRCVPSTSTGLASHHPACSRTHTIGTAVTRPESAGPHRVEFAGRVGGHPLPPATYQATLSASDQAGTTTATARFRVLP
jgi:uncharacterized delta-60 repeat protein